MEGLPPKKAALPRLVRCLGADVQLLVHDGYELTGKDYRELYLLHERFGVALPPKYAGRALATNDGGGWMSTRGPRSTCDVQCPAYGVPIALVHHRAPDPSQHRTVLGEENR